MVDSKPENNQDKDVKENPQVGEEGNSVNSSEVCHLFSQEEAKKGVEKGANNAEEKG